MQPNLKLFFILTIFLSIQFQNTFSQQTAEFYNGIDSIFNGLSYDSIPTAILIDKCVTNKCVIGFDAINDSISTFAAWYSIFTAIKTGAEYKNGFWSYANFQERISTDRDDGIIPIFAFHYDYNYLKAHALDSGLIDTIDGRLYDVLGRSESPYETGTVFSAILGSSAAAIDTLQFIWRTDQYFSNNTNSIDSFKIDFADGSGYREINIDSIITVIYLADGVKNIRYHMRLQNGIILESTSTFILKTSYEFPADETGYVCGDIIYDTGSGWDEFGISCIGFTITYGNDELGNQHTCLTKPFILIEGFDPGYPPEDWYQTWDDPKFGVLGWMDIVTGTRHYLPDPYDLDPDLNGPYIPQFNKGPDFVEMLWDNGYDIVYVDFYKGTNYMQKNAFALITLIDSLNTMKCGTEELVIAGASMGGQIARYALIYMEANNLPHCTRLFIPFDSPAKGASIPIGFQAMAKFFNYIAPSSNSEHQIAIANSPAAKQLLIHNFIANYPGVGAHVLRGIFYSEIEELGGYPIKLRKVAVVNGNKMATSPTEVGEGGLFLEINPIYVDTPIVEIIGYSKSAFIPGTNILDVGDHVYAGGINAYVAGLHLDGVSSYLNVSVDNSMPRFDIAPGSVRDDVKLMEKMLAKLGDNISYGLDVNSETFTFVPTISALDIYGTENLFFDINFNLFDNEAPYPGLYPFEAYFAPNVSGELHVQITDENINWIEEQILKNENNLKGNLPVTISGFVETYYNYGNLYQRKMQSVEINSGAVLQINGNEITGYGNEDYDITPDPGSTFTVYTNECNNSNININAGGILEIGDDNDPYDNNKGILELLEGSEIHVKNGGTLKIRKNSQLNLRSGSTLYLDAGGIIEIDEVGYLAVDNGGLLKLNGGVINLKASNAQLKLYAEGEIQVAAGVDFKLDSEGLFEYYQDGIFTMLGSTSKFILEGDGDTDLKMRLQENADFFIETHDVDIYNCKLSFHDNALFRVEANNTSLDLVNYEDFSSSVKARSAILASNIVSLDVYNCDFTGFNNPVKVEEVSVCPGDVNVNIQFSTFTGMGNLAITATNVDRIYMNGNTITGSVNAFGGVWLEDVTDATIDNGTIQGFLGSTDAGVFLLNTTRLILDAAMIKNNKYGVEMHASSIYLRNKATIKNNYTGIYAFGSIDYGTTNPTNTMKKISVGDVDCGWIINNSAYGINSLDMQLEIDQEIHSLGEYPIANRFDGNLYGIKACYDYYDADDLGGTEILAKHNHWHTGGGPATGYLQAGFDEDTHPCTSITFNTTDYKITKPSSCLCDEENCEEELTEEEITLRLAATSCNSTIPKPGGGGTVTVGQQFRTAYLKYLDGDYNYAYQSFNYLKNKVEQNYLQGLTKGVCNSLYREAVMYVELCSLLATVHCQQPFYTGRYADQFSDTEFKVELYPNPTHKEFTLFTDNAEIIDFKIMDITGREIITNSFQTNTNISVVGWSSGIYLVYLRSENSGLMTTLKLMVE